ncbi:hypothetical protein NUW58_g3334 [Xylaria curta]|uniref:Uncharacterized protein n=1 Tax=Xylaria curta TaxID=42375 RepID=A0ACC1PD57_9PEZI|nr:hypothetical protein NUW58_g3334 [Xylaria curta]
MPATVTANDSPRLYSRASSLRIAKGKSWDDSEDVWKALDGIAAFRLSLEHSGEELRRSGDLPRFSVCFDNSGIGEEPVEPLTSTPRPFHKWMKTLHRRAHRRSTGSSAMEQLPEYLFVENPLRINGHRKSSSGSSFGFVAAVKSATVYVTILASLPTLHHGLRSSINQNLTDIIELHEEILVHSQLRSTTAGIASTLSPRTMGGRPWLHSIPSVIAEPSVAAEVAQIFGRKMNRFLIYEEYGARYELMIKDVASAHRTLPHWENYQKGIEALASSLSAANNHSGPSRKSLTIGDLLVKPIQRICRYPLLFSELLKYTPVCDCPSSHMEIEGVLMRLRETTAEINRATDDPGVKASLEQTWLLQDRLVFPNQRPSATTKSVVRSLGQIRLCGALHVCWQTKDGVTGQYMVSLLYRDCLCLATAGKYDQVYTIQACIGLDSIKVEEADNGRGLQCHTAPFSWKLVFECDHQLYEMIMTACSHKEEKEWRKRLSDAKQFGHSEQLGSAFYSSNSLDIKSLGTVFRKPGSVARRLSIHRATTIGPKSALCQVVLKNTSTTKDITSMDPQSSINRSQSLLTTNSRIPVLAPPRAERARLEASLADVWSRKILPYPGMTSRSRNEHRVRSSASTMMRKLSVASLTNPFSKRSISTSGLLHTDDSDQMPHVNTFLDSLVSVNCDTLTPFGVEGVEGGPQQRLPIIRDEIERSSSGSGGFEVADVSKLEGTVRRVDMAKMEAIWGDEMGVDTPPLPTSSSHGTHSRGTPSPAAPYHLPSRDPVADGPGSVSSTGDYKL